MKNIGLRLLPAVTVAVASLTLAPPASARPRVTDNVDNGYLDWGVEQTFRTFVRDGNPPVAVNDGAEVPHPDTGRLQRLPSRNHDGPRD
jgi:hypothetical protein